MTAIDFVLMAAMVISTTFGLVRAGGAKHPIERGICLFGAVCVSVFAMAVRCYPPSSARRSRSTL